MKKVSFPYWLFTPIFLFLSIGVVSGKNESGVNQHRQVQTEASPYAIHDDQLRETMLQLNALVSFAARPTTPLDKNSKEHLHKLLDTVDVVAKSAELLKQTSKLEHLSDEQFMQFMALADQLHNEAINIDINARELKVEEMNEAFLNLNEKCVACHKLFRSL